MRVLKFCLIGGVSLAMASMAISVPPGKAAPQARGRVLGKLGQATSVAKIFAFANPESRVYYEVQPYEYLVVKTTRDPNWNQVLMKTGQYGFIEAEAVAVLPYEVSAKPAQRSSEVGSRSASAVANYSMNFIGTPYVWGGNDPQRGIDCSGFVKKMYGSIGVNLPRTAAEQAMVGQPISRLENLQKGDRLYFWDKRRGKIGHTGIYLGNGYFVHSSSTHRGVATDYLGEAKWRRILVAAKR